MQPLVYYALIAWITHANPDSVFCTTLFWLVTLFAVPCMFFYFVRGLRRIFGKTGV